MPTPEELFEACKKITQSKGEDYVTDIKTDRFENFSRSALVSSWFKDDKDKVYATLITVKLARLASLLGNKDPKNESIEDSFKDLINYSALWASDRLSSNEPILAKIGTWISVDDFIKVAHTKS